MKKALFFAAMTAVMVCFASCEKQEQKPSTSDKENQDNPESPAEKYRLLEDFEDGGMLTWTGSNGCLFEIADNPDKKGLNTSAKVGKITASGAQWEFTWSTYFGVKQEGDTPAYLDFSEDGYIVKVDVYSPKADSPVYLKIEGDEVQAIEIPTVKTTKSGEWETLTFDYEPYSPVDGAYRNFVILFDAGVETAGGEIFFYDNIRLCKE